MGLPTEPSGQLPIDRASLLARCMGDAAFAAKVLGMFTAEATAAVRTIEDALADGDVARAAKAAHTLKGMAANASATGLAEAARELEQLLLCTPATRDRAAAVMATLKAETDRCLSYIPAVFAPP